MPEFEYVGQLESGAAFQGTIEAVSHSEAAAQLVHMGVQTLSLRPVVRQVGSGKISLDDFQFLNEQIAAIARSGIPLEEGLRSAADNVATGRLRRLIVDLCDDLARGTPLPAAVAAIEKRLPTRYAPLIAAGMRTGDLGGALYGMTSYLRLRAAGSQAIVSLAAYPLMILIIGVAVMSLLMRAVVPQIQALLTELGSDGLMRSAGRPVPPLSDAIFSTAAIWPTVELVLWLLIGALVLLVLSSFTPFGARFREALARITPGISRVHRYSALARFAHTGALAAHASAPLAELVAAGGLASGASRLAAATERVAARLTEGRSLDEATRDEREIPRLWTCVVSTTAPRGELAAGLSELARLYEQRAEHWVRLLRVLLGPVLILLVSGVLALILTGLAIGLARRLGSLMQ